MAKDKNGHRLPYTDNLTASSDEDDNSLEEDVLTIKKAGDDETSFALEDEVKIDLANASEDVEDIEEIELKEVEEELEESVQVDDNPFGQKFSLQKTLIDHFDKHLNKPCDVLPAPVDEERRATDFPTIVVFPAEVSPRLDLSNTKDHPIAIKVDVYGAPVVESVDVRGVGNDIVKSLNGKKCRLNDHMCLELAIVNRSQGYEGMQLVHRMELTFSVAPRF